MKGTFTPGNDAVGATPLVTVVPMAEYVDRLTRAGFLPVTALFTAASIAVSDIATRLDEPGFPWPDGDADGVAEQNLARTFHDLEDQLRRLLERYTAAEARRIIAKATAG